MTDSGGQYGRRRILYLAGVVGASALAGCTGNGDDGNSDDTAGDDTDDTDDDSSDGDGTPDNDDDGDGDDGDDGNERDDEDGGEDNGDENGGEDDDGEDDGNDTGDGPRLRDVLAMEQSYVMEFDTTDGTGTWTFHEGDSYFEGSFNGESAEIYRIRSGSEIETYTVSDGQCFKTSIDLSQDDIFDPEEPEADSQEYYASGTETVDGQEAYVFDIEDGTYYVSVSTGYPVRFESGEGDVVRFHSWGETDPISPPDRECMEL